MPTVSAGTAFAVSQELPATYDKAGFAALTYTRIRGVRSVGDLGKAYKTAPNNAIGLEVPQVRRVGLAAQALPLELARIADAGQTILRAAIDASVSYSYQLTQPDGMLLCFTAAVNSRIHGGFAPGSIADTKCTLDIDSFIVEV